jgi:2-oxoisovalerate dehydrogenase E1 component alpha subunit
MGNICLLLYLKGGSIVQIVKEFAIPYYQYLNQHSDVVDTLPPFANDPAQLIELYRLMVLIRLFDNKAIALQRTGKLGTYPSTRGQEGVFVGIGHALAKTDIFIPYYRDFGTLIQRGMSLKDILLFWGGDERANMFATDNRTYPFAIPVGSQVLHAVGAAYALKYKQEQAAVLVTLGEGATSQGDFYEAMNVAGCWRLPVVFVICNNQWAISVARECQSAAQTLAQKAIAAGISGEQVDGNDVIAISDRVRDALHHARIEQRPHVLELICYRQADHTTADDAKRYEPAHLRAEEWKKEPIARLRHYLQQNNLWHETQELALEKSCMEIIEQAVADYMATPSAPLTDMIDFLYETLPLQLQGQRMEIQLMEKQ